MYRMILPKPDTYSWNVDWISEAKDQVGIWSINIVNTFSGCVSIQAVICWGEGGSIE